MDISTLPRLARAAIGTGLVGLSGCGLYQRAMLDREVDRLCAIDGGVQVYETVTLPKEDFGPDGEVLPQYRSLLADRGKYGPDYLSLVDSETLVAGDPKLVKWRAHSLHPAERWSTSRRENLL